METVYKLYNGSSSYLHYIASILGDETAEPARIERQDNLKLAKLALIQSLFVLDKEQILEDRGTLALPSKLLDDILEESVGIIIPRKENGFYLINGIEKTAKEAVTIIRDNFVKGNYKIDLNNDNIILKTSTGKTIISISKLNTLITNAGIKLLNSSNTDSVEYIITPTTTQSTIRNNEQLKSTLEKMALRKYKLVSIDGKLINKIDQKEFYEFMEVIKQYITSDVSYVELFKSYKKTLEKKGLKLEAVINRFSSKEIEEIVKIIGSEKGFYSLLDSSIQNEKLNELMLNIKAPGYQQENFIYGIIKNLIVINNIEYSKDFNINEFGIDGFVSIILSQFLMLYSLPFDKYYAFEKYRLNRDMLDFSKLDLSKFNPSKLTISSDFLQELEKEIEGYKKGAVDCYSDLEAIIKKVQEVRSGNDQDEITYWNSKLVLKTIEKAELKSMIDSKEKNLSLAKEEYTKNGKYFKNREIINGIKNSIVEGNVIIKKTALGKENFIKNILCFKDIQDGESKFELYIKIEDFLMLFREYNIGIIYDFIHKNEVKKTKTKVRK